MTDVDKFLLTQGVLGVFVILETALIWYLLGEVKRLGDKLTEVRTSTARFESFLEGRLKYGMQETTPQVDRVYKAEDLTKRQHPGIGSKRSE